MKKNTRKIAIFSAIILLIVFFVYKYRFSDDAIMVPNPPSNITQSTPVETIITKPDGTVVEKQYTYNPATTTIQIDSGYDEDNASLFFPGLALGFMFAEGNWVDHDGYYWHNNTWVQVDDNHWDDHWHNYWNNWNDHHWNNHWNNNHNHPNWNRTHPEHWQNPGGRSPGGHMPRGGEAHGGGRR